MNRCGSLGRKDRGALNRSGSWEKKVRGAVQRGKYAADRKSRGRAGWDDGRRPCGEREETIYEVQT